MGRSNREQACMACSLPAMLSSYTSSSLFTSSWSTYIPPLMTVQRSSLKRRTEEGTCSVSSGAWWLEHCAEKSERCQFQPYLAEGGLVPESPFFGKCPNHSTIRANMCKDLHPLPPSNMHSWWSFAGYNSGIYACPIYAHSCILT